MQKITAIKTIFAASLVLFIFACNNSSEKDKDQKDKPADTTIVKAAVQPPTTEPSGVTMEPALKKCFTNEGLKYKTVITIDMSGNEVSGNVTSEELESNKKETVNFEGIMSGDKLTITFKGAPPVVGAASEWTDKAWSIVNKAGKEKLRIVFNAKNYETNKWTLTDYEFLSVDCK